MRVLFLTTSYPLWAGDGRGAFVHELARRLVERGHEVDVVAARYSEASLLRETLDGVRVIRIPIFARKTFTFEELQGAGGWIAVALFLLRGALAALALRRRWNAIHAQWDMPWGPVAALLGMALGSKVIVQLRGFEERRRRTSLPFSPILRWTYRHSAQVLANAENVFQEASALGAAPPKLRLLHRGVDSTRFAPLPRDSALVHRLGLEGRKTILFAGDFIPRKGVQELLEAFDRVAREEARAVMVMLGSGPLEAKLRAAVDRKGLGSRVVWAGRVDYAEMPRWYSLADVFVLPTRADAAGNVVMEALACGRPVVTTSAMGWAETLKRAGGVWIVPPKSPEALAAVIGQLLKDPESAVRMARAGREYVLSNHTWRGELEEVLRCYSEARGEPSGELLRLATKSRQNAREGKSRIKPRWPTK